MANEVRVYTVTGEILKYWPENMEAARNNWMNYLIKNESGRVVSFGRFVIATDRVDFVEFKEG